MLCLRSKGADIAPPAVEKVEWIDKNTVKVYFNERLDADSANDPANYSINGDIGVVKKAELSGTSGYLRVDLTTPDLTNNKAYKITINGVKDRLDNEMANYVVGFTSGMKSADTERPGIDNIVAVNEDEVRVTFDEAVVAASTAAMTFTYGTETRNATVVGQGAPVSLYTIDDNTTVVFKVTPEAITNDTITTNDLITITALSGVKDLHNNSYLLDPADKPEFYGNTDDNDAPEVVAIDQVTVKKLQVTFSEPIIAPATITSDGITFTAEVDEDGDETTDALSVLTLTAGVIAYEKEFKFDFETANTVTDYVGKPSSDKAYEYTAYLDDDDNPVIDFVEAVSTTKVQVHFNESIATAGTYIIEDSEGKPVSLSNLVAKVDGDDDTIVNVTFTNNGPSWRVKPGDVFTLIPKTAARDIKGNALEDLSDLEFDFVAVTNYDYIKGVTITDAKTIVVELTSAFDTTVLANTLTVKAKGTSNDLVKASGLSNTNTAKTKVKAQLMTPLMDGVDYVVTVDGAVKGSFTVEGVLGDGGVSVDSNIVTFSGWNVNDYVVKVVYANAEYLVLPVDTTTPADGEDSFSIATLYLYATPTTAVVMPANASYVVEVYRTNEAIADTSYNDATTYKAAIDDGVNTKYEDAPLYSLKK